MRVVPALLGLVAALLPVERATAGSTAILPLAGDQRLTARLDPALGRAVAGRGLPAVLGPAEVRAHLAGEPAVLAALDRARRSIALSREQELRMDRSAALAAAREATRALEEIHGALYLPELVIRAHTSLALAALLRPDDPQAASQALRRVVALDPGYRPTPGQLSTQATRLLDEARPTARPLRPAAPDLAWVAQRLRLSRVLWIGLTRRRGERVTLEAILYDHARKRILRGLQLETTTGRLLRDATELAVQALDHGRVAAAAKRKTPRRPPWYRRWWVWAAAATVVAAGAGVGIGLAMTRTQETATTTKSIHFHF